MKRILKAILVGFGTTLVVFGLAILAVAIINVLKNYGSSAIFLCLGLLFVWILATIYWYKNN